MIFLLILNWRLSMLVLCAFSPKPSPSRPVPFGVSLVELQCFWASRSPARYSLIKHTGVTNAASLLLEGTGPNH